MGRNLNKLKFLIALCLALIPASGFSLELDPARVEIGDTGTFLIPLENHEASVKPIRNVRASLSGVPLWMDINPTSFIGPVDIYPGEATTFSIDFTINSVFNPASPNADVTIAFVSDSPSFIPSNLIWHFVTNNGFRTAQGESNDNMGITYEEYRSPDVLAPNTYLNYEGPSYNDLQENIYLSTQTRVYFEGSDSYDIDTEISGVFLTGYQIDSVPVSFDTLNFSTMPVVLPEGQHILYFASRDNAGNTEVVKSSTVYADGTAPVTNLQIIGSSTTDSQGNLVISSNAYISFDGNDNVIPASGLNRIMFSIDDGEFGIYASSFTLPEGHHKIEFFGIDNVENSETTHIFEAWPVMATGIVPATGVIMSCRRLMTLLFWQPTILFP